MSDTPAPAALGGLSAEESEKLQEAFKDIATRSQKLLQEFDRYAASAPHRHLRPHCRPQSGVRLLLMLLLLLLFVWLLSKAHKSR